MIKNILNKEYFNFKTKDDVWGIALQVAKF